MKISERGSTSLERILRIDVGERTIFQALQRTTLRGVPAVVVQSVIDSEQIAAVEK